MGYLSLLGSYGLRRFLDVVSSIMLKFGLRFVDKLMDGDTTSTPGGGDTSLHGSGVGSGVVAGRQMSGWMDGDTTFEPRGGDTSLPGSGVGSGVVAGRQMSGCGHCVVVVEFQDASQFSSGVSLVVP